MDLRPTIYAKWVHVSISDREVQCIFQCKIIKTVNEVSIKHFNFILFCYFNTDEIDSIHRMEGIVWPKFNTPIKNMSYKAKATVDVAAFQASHSLSLSFSLTQTQELSTEHHHKKHNTTQIVKTKSTERSVAVIAGKRIFCLCFDLRELPYFLLYAHICFYSFPFWTLPFRIHIGVRCLYQNWIIVRETTEKLHLWMKAWVNEWMNE